MTGQEKKPDAQRNEQDRLIKSLDLLFFCEEEQAWIMRTRLCDDVNLERLQRELLAKLEGTNEEA